MFNGMPWRIKKKIIEYSDRKWDDKCKVYGIYDENDEIVYIGKTNNVESRWREHKKKYNNHTLKELKKGTSKDLNWEIAYIQWYGLKYKLDNKLHRLKKIEPYNEFKQSFKDYYNFKYLYKNPYIKKLDIIDSISIFKTLKKSVKQNNTNASHCRGGRFN